MKYTVTLERSLHGCATATALPPMQTKLVLHAAPGEVAWHIALKLIGFVLFMEYAPRIEEGIGWHYKPDLVALDAHGGVRLWVDCGNIAVRKIERVAQKVGPHAPFVILRRTARDARLLAQSLGVPMSPAVQQSPEQAKATGQSRRAAVSPLSRSKMRYAERVRIFAFENGMVDALAAALDTTNHIQVRVLCVELDSHGGPEATALPTPESLQHLSLTVRNRKGDNTMESAITLYTP